MAQFHVLMINTLSRLMNATRQLTFWRGGDPFDRVAAYLALAVALHALILLLPVRHASSAPHSVASKFKAILQEQSGHAPAHQRLPESNEPRTPKAPAKRELPATVLQPGQASTRAIAAAPLELTTETAPTSSPVRADATPVGGSPVPKEKSLSQPRFDAAYLNNPEPNYPLMSRRQNETGKVVLKVNVSAEGHPVAVDIAQSSHSVRLDDAARQAVSRWRFIPAKLGEQPVAAEVLVPIVFRLD